MGPQSPILSQIQLVAATRKPHSMLSAFPILQATYPAASINPAPPASHPGVSSAEEINDVPPISWTQPSSNFGDFALFIDSMNMPCGSNGGFFVDQPTLALSPHPLFSEINEQQWHGHQQPPHIAPLNIDTDNTSTPRLFDEFSSTFPSFESPSKSKHEPWRVTQQDWEHLLGEIQTMVSIIPPEFSLPSRHTMTRYIATYFSGFHRHLPFLHVPTFEPTKCPVELILAMATIGAQSAFDNANAVMFFRTSYAIALERLRNRKAQLRDKRFPAEDASTLTGAPLGSQNRPWVGSLPSNVPNPSVLPSDQDEADRFDPLSISQTLLVLMAMATWGNSKAIYNEAIGIQNILVEYMREEKLLEARKHHYEHTNWAEWIRAEGHNRTVGIIFCFFIFHTIVYDTPPPILNSELHITLPSLEISWAARSDKDWQESRKQAEPEVTFQSCFSLLFAREGEGTNMRPKACSSLGAYILILALIQHIYFLREMAKRKAPFDQGPAPNDVAEVEQALKNWQHRWYMDPESSFGPGSPHGPISFNSTALLRMAYIRLTVDVGPWRALNTHDAEDIAASIHRSPELEPNHKLTRAVLYSAHALSIPVKIGVNIVARNQAFAWSLQHSLSSLPGVPLGEDESRLLAYVVDMVAEADSGFHFDSQRELTATLPDLCIRVVQIWARLLSGVAVWDVVRMIGKALAAYGRILEQQWGKPESETVSPNDTN
ncbi:hypothetical protein N7541_000798 [Penicillium brevicompactum]|uniref:Xylanolytic transcriptional activator regulatory domain-containing protein n=1 Tax=Penicillium brevicompactum TaxID=5074 RepID=A0A9W9RV38_PENBR|nr:hypothetical protein N7541_000798 [Penicillium brevicompactum]